MSSYAIVRFIEEDDFTGIVATNWMNGSKTVCSYPNVINQDKKNKFLLERKEPAIDWLSYPIRVVKQFDTYETAKRCLVEAEKTSDLKKESTLNQRKKNLKEDDDLEEEIYRKKSSSYSKKIEFIDLYPVPLPSTYPVPSSSTYPVPSPSTCPVPSPSTYPVPSPSTYPVPSPSSIQQSPKPLLITHPLPTPPAPSKLCTSSGEKHSNCVSHCLLMPNQSATSSVASSPFKGPEILKQLRANRALMWKTFKEFSNVSQRISSLESKMDSLLAFLKTKLPSPTTPALVSEESEFISSLPVGEERMLQLESKLKESSAFRLKLGRILMTVTGKDIKSFVAGMLRRLVRDEVGITYSLTGKGVKNGGEKKPFGKTEVFKLVSEISFRVYKEGKEAVLREAVSEWLAQAKFRMSRRNARLQQRQYLLDEDRQPQEEENNLNPVSNCTSIGSAENWPKSRKRKGTFTSTHPTKRNAEDEINIEEEKEFEENACKIEVPSTFEAIIIDDDTLAQIKEEVPDIEESGERPGCAEHQRLVCDLCPEEFTLCQDVVLHFTQQHSGCIPSFTVQEGRILQHENQDPA